MSKNPETLKPDITDIAQTIERYCPDWKIDSIHLMGEGDFCRAYLVNAVWVFRFGKHQTARESLRRESCLLPHLAAPVTLQIPAPQVSAFDEAAEVGFAGYPLLPGVALTQERYLNLDDTDRTRCAGQVATFLNQLHGVELSMAVDCGVPVRNYATEYADLLERAQCELFPLLAEAEQLFIEQVINTYLASDDALNYHPTLLHGDLSPDHVLFDETSQAVTGIIDFGDMMIGDPAWDLVFIYEDFGLDFLSRVLTGFHHTDRTALFNRLFQLYLIAAIDWAAGSRARGQAEFDEALELIQGLRLEAAQQRNELFSRCKS